MALFAVPLVMAMRSDISEQVLATALLVPAGVAALLLLNAYGGRAKGATVAIASHCGFALRSVWLAVVASVLFGLILFSVSKPLKGLGIDRAVVVQVAAALLSLWFVGRAAFGMKRALSGEGFRAVDPTGFSGALGSRWPLLLYVVILMTAFNFFSHGTQDLYPTFLKVQHHFAPGPGLHAHHRRQLGGHRRRDRLRGPVAEDRQAARHRPGRGDRPAGAAPVGVLHHAPDAGGGGRS